MILLYELCQAVSNIFCKPEAHHQEVLPVRIKRMLSIHVETKNLLSSMK